MIVDKNIADLICTLEYIIGNQTYNDNSYNGWTKSYGCDYRYPVCYTFGTIKNPETLQSKPLERNTTEKVRYIKPEHISSMVYKYGANHLHIGRSLIEILEFLEKRYNINFNELIKNDIEIRQLHMYKRKCLLEQGISINVENCTWEVGIDILDGKYEIYNSDKDYSFVHVYNTKGKRVKNISSKTHKATITIKNGYKLVFNKNHTIRMKVEI